MKFSTIASKANMLLPAQLPSLTFARKHSGECMWFDVTGVLCRYSDTAKGYEQRFVPLSLNDMSADDWYIIKAPTTIDDQPARVTLAGTARLA